MYGTVIIQEVINNMDFYFVKYSAPIPPRSQKSIFFQNTSIANMHKHLQYPQGYCGLSR